MVRAENASGVNDRYASFIAYLTKELGTKVTLRVANDYAAVIEGQRAGNIHVAMYGPAAYARAYVTGVKAEPFAIEVSADGTKGYYSVLYVKKDSPYQKLTDLKGKNLCLVDPNSASGNNVPRFAMNKMDIDPDKYFSKVVYAGSHENAVIAVAQGTCDAAFNWWNDESESNLLRMDRKGMAKAADFRIVFKSEQIVNSPMAYLTELPADLKAKIKTAVPELAIIGIVGAGGIGQQLSEQIRTLEWQRVAFIIIMILITVAIIDWVSSRLRFAIIGKTAR